MNFFLILRPRKQRLPSHMNQANKAFRITPLYIFVPPNLICLAVQRNERKTNKFAPEFCLTTQRANEQNKEMMLAAKDPYKYKIKE